MKKLVDRIILEENPRIGKRNFLLSSGELKLRGREREREILKNSKSSKEDVNFHQKSKDRKMELFSKRILV